MRYLLMVLAWGWGAPLVAGGGAERPPIELGATIRLGFAGVSLALPEDFRLVTSAERQVVLQAAQERGGKPVVTVTLSAWPVSRQLALRSFAANRNETLKGLVSIRDLKVHTSRALKVAGLPGQVQIQSYTSCGVETTALRLFLLRSPSGWKFQMGYVLAVEAERRLGQRALSVFSAVVPTLKFFDPVSPASEKVTSLGPAIVTRRWGYAFRPPEWWKAQVAKAGDIVTVFQTDYLRGWVRMPWGLDLARMPEGRLQVVRSQDGPERCARAMLALYREVLKRLKRTGRLVQQGPAKMAGRQGYQFVLKYRSIDPAGGQAGIVVIRAACANGLGYVLMLNGDMNDPKPLVSAVDRMAQGLELTKPQQPATQAATAPTTTQTK